MLGVYIDINMIYSRTRRGAGVPGARRLVLGGVASLALLLVAGCAPLTWNTGSPGTDLPPLGIPGVFLTQGHASNHNGPQRLR